MKATVDDYVAMHQWMAKSLHHFGLLTAEQVSWNRRQEEHEIAHREALMDYALEEWAKLPRKERRHLNQDTWIFNWKLENDTWETV